MKNKSVRLIAALLICAMTLGGFMSTNMAKAASSWTLVGETHLDYEAHMEGFLNESYGISVGRYGEVHYTLDGGKTWSLGGRSEKCRLALDIVNEELAWCGGFGSQISISRDGGKTWSNVSNFPLGGVISNINFIDDTTGWACYTNKMMATADGGETWNYIPLPEEAQGIAALMLRSAEDGYVFTRNGLLLHTTDGGQNWDIQDVDISAYNVRNVKNEPGLYQCSSAVADIAFADENNGVIVFDGVNPGKGMEVWCLRTADGGQSWSSERIPMPDGFRPVRLFLSRDAKFLTLGSYNGDVILMKS